LSAAGWDLAEEDADVPSGNNRPAPIFIFMTNRVLAGFAFASFPLGLVLGVALNFWSH
jgi:hypothetical protein